MLLLGGCAAVPQQDQAVAQDLNWVRAGADMLQHPAAPTEDPATLLRVDDDMLRFARRVTDRATGTPAKTAALVRALSAAKGLHLQYDADATLTAEEVFRQHRANCLSYTMLFIALARAVGVDARFNEVDIPPVWDFGNDKISLLYRHVDARVPLTPPFAQIVDISGGEYDPGFDQYVIPDTDAEAQYYNNRAVALRLQDDPDAALRYGLRALELSPGTAYLWTNLSSLYLRYGHPRAALIAVQQALRLDPDDALSYQTASQVYQAMGRKQLAATYAEGALHVLDRNPYYHFQLALAAERQDEPRSAYVESQRAISLYSGEPRFFALQARILAELGQPAMARASLQQAIDLASNPALQARYRDKLARLTGRG